MEIWIAAITTGATAILIIFSTLLTQNSIRENKKELKAGADKLETELKTDINNFRTEVKADMDKLEDNMDKLKADLKSDFRAEIGSVRAEIGSLRNELNANIVSSENKIKLDFAEAFYKNSNGNGGNGKKPAKKTTSN